MKIVGFSDVVTPISELITDVCVQNGINPDDIQLVREYKIDVTRRTYRNAIVRCTIDVLTKYTTTGVTLNGRSHRCFEQVKVLQCYKCYAFGHIANRCVNKPACIICAAEHKSDECDDETNKFSCINCKIAGKTIEHKVTADNCPLRLQFINRRIDLLGAKTTRNN